MHFKPLTNYTLLPTGEEDPLNPQPSQQTHTRWNRRRLWQWALPGVLAIGVILALVISQATKHGDDSQTLPDPNLPACPQYPALKTLSESKRNLEKEVQDELSSEDFFNKSLKRMQGAVRIPTESFDDMGPVGEDPRWDVFPKFHEYLEKTFPRV
jgi:Gly-Xaa carboxypeptidase